MNLEKFRLNKNLSLDTVVIDGESMMLAVLLRNKYFGLTFSEEGFEAFQNKVIKYFTSKNIPVALTYLGEDNSRKLQEKQLGLAENENIKLTIDELNALDKELVKSPCINVCDNFGSSLYQLDYSIIKEKSDPSIYNGAMESWSGNPYYAYLLESLAPKCTVDRTTRRKLYSLGEEFVNELDRKDKKEYFDSYVVGDTFIYGREPKTEPEEQKVSKIYDNAVAQSVTKAVSTIVPIE